MRHDDSMTTLLLNAITLVRQNVMCHIASGFCTLPILMPFIPRSMHVHMQPMGLYEVLNA